MHYNVYAMASKGLRTNHLSSYTEIDAGDELRKPLKPLLAIACVVASFLFLLIVYLSVHSGDLQLPPIIFQVFVCLT